MSQRNRILLAVLILVVISGVVLGIDALNRRRVAADPAALPPGAIPIYVDGGLAGAVTPEDLAPLTGVKFVDKAEGVEQTGWLLRDVIAPIAPLGFPPDALIRVSSSSRNKAAEVTWAEADDPANFVMFDLSNRGTLKLVSLMERLDTREEWVQDVTRIDIRTALR